MGGSNPLPALGRLRPSDRIDRKEPVSWSTKIFRDYCCSGSTPEHFFSRSAVANLQGRRRKLPAIGQRARSPAGLATSGRQSARCTVSRAVPRHQAGISGSRNDWFSWPRQRAHNRAGRPNGFVVAGSGGPLLTQRQYGNFVIIRSIGNFFGRRVTGKKHDAK